MSNTEHPTTRRTQFQIRNGGTGSALTHSAIVTYTLIVTNSSAYTVQDTEVNDGIPIGTAPRPGGIEVTWRTSDEQNALGFFIDRSATNSRADAAQVGSGMIAARGMGAAYVWMDVDRSAGLRTYWLQAVDIDGSALEFGPVQAAYFSNVAYLPQVMRDARR